MNFDAIIEELKAKKLAGRLYQKSGGRFKDVLTVRRDGAFVFERYNYGEAAGLVCRLRAGGAGAAGELLWNWDACAYSQKKQAAPLALSGVEGGALLFDGDKAPWSPAGDRKSLPGLSRLKLLFSGRK